jgi:hypothetical protein
MSATTSKTIFLLSPCLGLVTSRIIERQRQALVESSISSSSSIECVIILQADDDDEYEYEDTMCQRRLQNGAVTDEYHYVELPEMLELLYEDEIEKGSLVVSIAGGEIEDDEVVWDHISDFKVLESSDAIICRVGIQDLENEENAGQTKCIQYENGMETTRMYKMTLPEPMISQFEQAIEDGTLFLSMNGATIDDNRLIVPENESNIKALVLEAEEE